MKKDLENKKLLCLAMNFETPLGQMLAVADEECIIALDFIDSKNVWVDEIGVRSVEENKILLELKKQLSEYFDGKRRDFDVKLNPNGTEFQKRVWNELLKIPFGKTKTYLEQAKLMNNEKGIRAIASANGKNKIAIVIPCHRVIGSNGSLTGYAGGLWRKKWLLEHESNIRQQQLFCV
jgi:methylated-DNA-[protein]-cysteine S-methyltransferase